MKLFDFSWEEVVRYLRELANDDTALEGVVKKAMNRIIKEMHPSDHRKFIETNKEELEEIKLKIMGKYKKEIQQKINELFP